MIVRQMKQRWGSMSPAHRLLLNRRLVKASVDVIDYVIITRFAKSLSHTMGLPSLTCWTE